MLARSRHEVGGMIGLLKSLSDLRRGRPLVSGRIYLRPPARKDWKQWAALRAQSRAFLERWEPLWSGDTLTRKAFLRRLRAYAMNSQADASYSFFIFRAADDVLLGGVSLNHVRRGISQTCSIGYWIGEPYARQGYMTEAVSGLLPFAFDHLRLHRVGAACLPNNEASRGLLEKLGFTEEGYARKYLRINGEWHDHVLYAILSTDPRPQVAPALARPEPIGRIEAQVDRALARAPATKLRSKRGRAGVARRRRRPA
jgi:ribosomal-protein-alanine N-acetyltransferase